MVCIMNAKSLSVPKLHSKLEGRKDTHDMGRSQNSNGNDDPNFQCSEVFTFTKSHKQVSKLVS